MKYSLSITNPAKINIVNEFKEITKRNGFKQNALLLEYMEYVVAKLKQHEKLKESSFENITQMDVYFDKNRVELGLINEK